MSSSAKLKQTAALDEILMTKSNARTNVRRTTEAKDQAKANQQNNPFFQVIFNAALTPEEKQAEVTKILTFAGTREQNRERVKAFEDFKEFLQAEREAMATRIIELSDVETYATLRDSYETFNQSLMDFERDIEPLLDIIDAIHELTAEGQTIEAFREIKEDAIKREELRNKQTQAQETVDNINKDIDRLKQTIRKEELNKGFFGFGAIKPESAEAIAKAQVELDKQMKALATESKELEVLKNTTIQTESKINNQEAKEQLRKMLDLGSEEHRGRSEALVNSALSFVRNSKTQLDQVRTQLSSMSDQIRRLDDSNGQISMVYAILNEGVKDAEVVNKDIRKGLMTASENENMVKKLDRESKLQDMNDFVAQLEVSAVDTQTTVSDLVTQSIRIKNMSDSNRSQLDAARNMRTQGVAGVADRLAAVISAVGAAATNEANAIAAQTLKAMAENTDTITQKHSMQLAMGVQDRNLELERAINSLAQYAEVNRAATEITREGLEASRRNLEDLEKMSRELEQGVRDSKGVAADVAMGYEEQQAPKVANTFFS